MNAGDQWSDVSRNNKSAEIELDLRRSSDSRGRSQDQSIPLQGSPGFEAGITADA
ncbi:hypothetical protein [Paenibacillus chibensis]|nr:hypothetical protein [Paenibacillus chibensis]